MGVDMETVIVNQFKKAQGETNEKLERIIALLVDLVEIVEAQQPSTRV